MKRDLEKLLFLAVLAFALILTAGMDARIIP